MKTFSCAIAAHRAGEDPIGTAGHYQTYVLIECPRPWAAKAFESKSIPAALRQYVSEIKQTQSVQFLCVAQGTAPPVGTTVMVYERTDLLGRPFAPESLAANDSQSFTDGYRGYEFKLESIDQVVHCLETYWQRKTQGIQPGQRIVRQDLLVCTHGMRDKCCAQFGQPFFRKAKALAEKGLLSNVHVWQASHIGGHRFAPTAISLPDGRYYGGLTVDDLQAINSRKGAISKLHAVYRGWGVLPKPLQVLEQQLFLSEGWAWLNNKVAYRLLSPASDVNLPAGSAFQAELSVQTPDGEVITHQAKIVRDTDKTYCAKASCEATSLSTLVKYTVAEHIVAPPLQSVVTSPAIASIASS